MNGNVIRTITIRGTSEGLDKVTADLNKLASAQENVAVVSEQSAKRVLSLEDAWKRQTLKLDEAVRAQANIARETKIADAALREGLATQAQHAQRLEQINQRYNLASQSTQKFAQQTGLARHELINLGRQAQDVGVSLVSGQSPLMVLAQQGSQIADVFISSGKSVGSFFSQAVGWAGRFVFSLGGIATAVAGVVGGIGYLASSFAAAQKEIDKALSTGGGAASGVTREGINRIAEQSAGGGMSIAEARQAAMTFAQTGQIYEKNISAANNVTRDFARAMGIDAAEAAKQLAAALVDPSKGAFDLNKQMAFLDTTLIANIRTLQTHGDLQGAQKVLLDATARAAKQQADEVGGLSAAWNSAKAALDKFDEANAKAMARSLERLTGVNLGGFSDLERLTSARQKQQSLQSVDTRGMDAGTMQAYVEQTKAAADAVALLEQRLADLAKRTEQQKLLQLSEDAKKLVETFIPAAAEVEILTKAIADLEKAYAAGVGGAYVQAAIAAAKERLDVGKETLRTNQTNLNVIQQTADAEMKAAMANEYSSRSVENMRKNEQVSIAHNEQINKYAEDRLRNLWWEGKIINANTDEEKAQIKARQTYNELLREGVDGELAAAIARKQRSNEMAQIEQREVQQSQRLAEAADDRAAASGRAAAAAQQEAFQYELMLRALVDFQWKQQGMAPFIANALGGTLFESNQGGKSQFNPQGYTSQTTAASILTMTATNLYGPGGFDTTTGAPNAQGLEYQFNRMGGNVPGILAGGVMTTRPLGYPTNLQFTPQLDTAKLGIAQRAIELLPKEQQAAPLQQLIKQLEAAPKSLQGSELIQQLNDKLQQLITATEDNTSATSAMTDVLSPFYSSDPRRTHLGFRAFAHGGIMTQDGMLPLRQYQGGGMATSPQVAVFGEGSTPEAYVPVPSGRIPVEIRQPANSNVRPVNVTINVMGNADAGTVAALKSTAFQQAQAMRRMMG